MKDEHFDLVDENNKYMGDTALRSVVHTEGLWHRSVHIYFFRKDKNDRLDFLVHLRSKTKDLDGGRWDTRFGGHLKAGESIAEAAMSEIEEEVGLKLELNDLIEGSFQKDNHFPNRQFTKNFYYRFDGSIDELGFNDGEVAEVKWMSEDDIEMSFRTDKGKWVKSAPLRFDEIRAELRKKLNTYNHF